jgi:NADPH2:quinone reductase
VKANRILLKNVSVVGLHWGAYAINEPERVPETFRALFEMYDRGEIAPVIYRTYALDELPAALEALGSRRSYGKVIISPS